MKDTPVSDSTRSHSQQSKATVMSKESASREKQREAARAIEKPLKLGDKWYLLSKDWFDRWAAYIGINESGKVNELPPEKITNRKLFELDPRSNEHKLRLRENLLQDIDYVSVPQELWNLLVGVYSVESQDDIIEREVIDDTVDELDGNSNLRIEIRRMQVQMECSYNNRELSSSSSSSSATTAHVQELSRHTKMDEIIRLMKQHFKVPADKPVRLYFRNNGGFNRDTISQVDLKENSTLLTTSYGPEDTIVMHVLTPEEAEEAAKAPPPRKTAPPPAPALPVLSSSPSPSPSCTSTRNSSQMTTRNQANNGASERRGLCGLSNLGNTCFMNSALQCMSNVPPLTDFFFTEHYKSEINTVNPLGRRGEIAEAYANLVSEIWSGQNSYVIPRQFKLAISKFAPQFTGYQQQDSQELLAFLLDGLHEDLNRILKKPYVELGSHVGKSDQEFADESWQDHLKRNNSIIVDIFHGLLKSTLNCLVCKEISIKFDPFCYLSVPLPSKKERLVEVIFVPMDPSQPLLKCKLAVLKNGTIQDLCASMESLLEKDASIVNKVPRSRMVVCDVYSNKFFKVFEPNESVMPIKDKDDIFIYELQSNLNNPDFIKIKLHMREATSSHSMSLNCFGLPQFLVVPRENLTYGLLYQYSLKHLKRFLSESVNSSYNKINSKLNNSLSVNDQEPITPIDQDTETANGDNSSEEDDSRTITTRSSTKKPFSLHVSKSENVDYDSSSNSSGSQINDDTPFEWPATPTTTSSHHSWSSWSHQMVSLCADFTNDALKRFYKGPRSSDPSSYSSFVVEHSSVHTTQLAKQRKDVITLADCFTLYTKMEELSAQDYWYCSKCKAHQASTKKFDLWKLPLVLVVHLKRFSYDRLYRDKIDTLVDFPLTDLDMEPYLINKQVSAETKYSLIAVSNHYGSLGGGHYTAYGKNRYDGRWYYFDDSSVSASDEASVCTSAAYMLIYLRKDLHDVSIGTGLGLASSWSQWEQAIKNSAVAAAAAAGAPEKMDH